MKARALVASLISASALLLLLAVPSARAQGNSCVDEAAQQKRECTAECREEYQVARDNCVNKDHGCMEICRAQRAECREATGLEAAIGVCNDALYAEKQRCRNVPNSTPEEIDRCIDAAQEVAFGCRDGAREEARPGLLQCRREFRACARACPPADPPVTVDDRRQCKADARLQRDACIAGCREEFQFLKDACLNRDHVCMEQCRATRDGCRQPILDQLEADIAACNAIRDPDIQDCKNDFPEGSPERDACIDAVQLEAFRCKDAARERARPGLRDCRDDFRTCALGCEIIPPP